MTKISDLSKIMFIVLYRFLYPATMGIMYLILPNFLPHLTLTSKIGDFLIELWFGYSFAQIFYRISFVNETEKMIGYYDKSFVRGRELTTDNLPALKRDYIFNALGMFVLTIGIQAWTLSYFLSNVRFLGILVSIMSGILLAIAMVLGFKYLGEYVERKEISKPTPAN